MKEELKESEFTNNKFFLLLLVPMATMLIGWGTFTEGSLRQKDDISDLKEVVLLLAQTHTTHELNTQLLIGEQATAIALVSRTVDSREEIIKALQESDRKSVIMFTRIADKLNINTNIK